MNITMVERNSGENRGQQQKKHDRKKVSVVVSAYNEEGNVEALWNELSTVLDNLKSSNINWYEVIFVDDGSKDGTFKKLIELKKNNPPIKIVKFSRNFGHETAMTAGLDFAIGDCVVLMDADLQHPPELLPKMISRWQDGHDIVMTKRKDGGGKSIFRKAFYNVAYKILNTLQDESIPNQSPDFRLIDRHYVDILKSMDEKDRMLRGLLSWAVAEDFVFVPFTPRERISGESKYSIRSLLKLGLDGIVSFTDRPLKLALYLGAIAMVFALFLGAFTVWHHLFVDSTKTGYATILVSNMFLGSIQLLVLGVVGTYIGKIHFEVKKRPLYIAKFYD